MRPARRTKSYAAADTADADGIKVSFASSTTAAALTAADWDGAAISASGVLDLPRTVTITRTSAANQYAITPIVLTGYRGGVLVTESLTPANDDGNDVLRGTQAFDRLTAIDIPVQGGTGGAFTIGVQDICAPAGDRFCGVDVHTDGTLFVQYGEAAGSPADGIAAAIAVYRHLNIEPSRVLTGTGKTIVGVTVYLP